MKLETLRHLHRFSKGHETLVYNQTPVQDSIDLKATNINVIPQELLQTNECTPSFRRITSRYIKVLNNAAHRQVNYS